MKQCFASKDKRAGNKLQAGGYMPENGKYPLLLKRGIYMIIHWDNETDNPNIIHYHGTKDHTLPYRRMDHVITVKGGSHMMALTRGKEIVL